MAAPLDVAVFVLAAVLSLGTSWVLVTRLERVGARLGLSEALLGVVAALAADAPEITAAITALAHHERRVGAGVVIGSNVFNLAALLGLGAVVAGRIGLHRKVVLLGGIVATWVATICLAAVVGLLSPAVGLAMALGAFVLYLVVLAERPKGRWRLPLPRRWVGWLGAAVVEEELELVVAIHPRAGRLRDAVVAAGSLVVVVAASVVMERSAVDLGARYAVPDLVIGGIVLAAVTSLPNAVAANYLAAQGRGAALLSTALTSNNLNVIVGLFVPATLVGLGRPSGPSTLVAAWYAGLTVFVLASAYRSRGLSRGLGVLVIAAYAVFATTLVATGHAASLDAGTAIGPAVVVAIACAVWLAIKHRS
jgi:cation:H+ antiporter